ncbi:ribokinase [Paenibacillus sp. MER TA 81-3]|uniref:ribokinase n=1 Tax=Paenibacillus sp. MER TA 81-3 TaxID=2939573 RepID=UPI0020411690|nr:ribokinase [Paenibacillus sp. MER TA 81-3]MCM3340197.1 ribokinase [Paenibacillus sp. MER TA 81-3]
MRKARVTVIGSLNVDMVTVTSTIPEQGETVRGDRFATMCGGKGANQAIACARLGAEVRFIGCVGDDAFGQMMLDNLQQEQIHTEGVDIISEVASGTASIIVNDGDNRIIVVPGANGLLTPDHIRRHAETIRSSDVILMQLEIPLPAVREALSIAAESHVPVILNPAPAMPLTDEMLAHVSILTPNEHELAALFGGDDSEQAFEWKTAIRSMPGRIVLTRGADGAYWSDTACHLYHQPGYEVNVIDTTGAGDTFNGALAVLLAEGNSMDDAVHGAVAASALAVTQFGAQSGMPTRSRLEQQLKED